MKFLTRFGCGCVGIDLGEGQQLIVESCYGDNDYNSTLFLRHGDRILPANLPGTPDPVATERLIGEINRLLIMGRKFETLQQTLGIEVKR